MRLKRRIKRKFMTKRAPHSSLHISHRVARIWLHGCNLVALICAPLLVSLVKYCSDISLSCNLKLRLPATCLFQLTQKKKQMLAIALFEKAAGMSFRVINFLFFIMSWLQSMLRACSLVPWVKPLKAPQTPSCYCCIPASSFSLEHKKSIVGAIVTPTHMKQKKKLL